MTSFPPSSEFALAPWETRTDLPRVGSVFVQHTGYDMSEQNGQLWLRKTLAPTEGAFLATGRAEAPFVRNWLGALAWRRHEPTAWRASLGDILSKGKLCRVFFVGPTGELRQSGETATHSVMVGAGGWAQWTSWRKERPSDAAAFLWTHNPNLSRFLDTPSLDLWAQIRDQWADESSDCAFAWRCLGIATSQIEELLWNWTRDEINEARQVLTWWLQMQVDYWEDTECLSASIDFGELTQGHAVAFLNRTLLDGTPVILSPEELQDALPLLIRRFGPPLREEVISGHLHIRRWLGENENQQLMSLVLTAPTAHEQLEAALQWREWSHDAVTTIA